MGLPAFKAYDIRGRIPDELNETIAYRVGRAFSEEVGRGRVAIGRDVRLSSQALSEALARGLIDGGCEVLDIGLCGTEMVYFATAHEGLAGGIMVTASHNPMDYNGLKLVREQAIPISADSGLKAIEHRVEKGAFEPVECASGSIRAVDLHEAYCEHLLGYIDASELKPLKVVVNAGNGGAGVIIDRLAEQLPLQFIRIDHEPDGNFPNGIPNPLLPEKRERTAAAVREHGADLGLAWDGDYDRCFFFDEHGDFVESYYIISLLAESLLHTSPGANIIYDARLTWNTRERVAAAGGVPVQSKSGHAFMKESMRRVDALYGGEMSGHHFFRDFYYCDSGMIPWLLLVGLLSRQGGLLSTMVAEQQRAHPVSGEINRSVEDVEAVIAAIEAEYASTAERVEHMDGLSVEYADWRFNLRGSNTEPLLRLNVESRGDRELMQRKTEELLQRIGGSE